MEHPRCAALAWPDASRACEPGQLLPLPPPCSCLSLVGMETRTACLPALGLPGGASPGVILLTFAAHFLLELCCFFFFSLHPFWVTFVVTGLGGGGRAQEKCLLNHTSAERDGKREGLRQDGRVVRMGQGGKRDPVRAAQSSGQGRGTLGTM